MDRYLKLELYLTNFDNKLYFTPIIFKSNFANLNIYIITIHQDVATTRSGPTRLDWLSLRKSVWQPGKDIKNVEVKIVYAALITKFSNIDDTLSTSPIIDLFINSDAILNRDALWSIQGKKHYLQAAIVGGIHHT